MTHLVSSILHFGGAAAFLLAAPGFLVHMGRTPGRRAVGGFYVFSIVFLLVMSGLYHIHVQLFGDPAAEPFRRMDHIGIWVLIAGFFLPIHLFALRGLWRWVPLAVVGSATTTGLALKIFWFGALTLPQNFVFYLLVSLIGVASVVKLARERGLPFVRWLLVCWSAFMLAAVFFVVRPPDLIPEAFGHHELWHIGILMGITSHWIFVRQIAGQEREVVSDPLPLEPVALPA